MNGNTFRNGKVHVCKEMCSTCVFRPGNLMHLDEGRLEDMIADATRENSAIICHSTLDGDHATCRGFYDQHRTQTLQVAERLGFIKEVEPPELTKD